MSIPGQNQTDIEKQWKSIYILGGAATVIVIIGTIIDIIIGSMLGGDLTQLPKTAIERFAQFQTNPLLGLYYLDLLNMTTIIILVPSIYSLYAAHRHVKPAYAMFALIIYIIGAIVFICSNTALPMMELSSKYASATSEIQKAFYASAGEGFIARGAHGSPGVFLGFAIIPAAEIIMSFVMLRGNLFSKITSYMGIFGGVMILIYVILVTFIPAAKNIAMILAMPGGLSLIAWMIMYSIKLFKLGLSK